MSSKIKSEAIQWIKTTYPDLNKTQVLTAAVIGYPSSFDSLDGIERVRFKERVAVYVANQRRIKLLHLKNNSL